MFWFTRDRQNCLLLEYPADGPTEKMREDFHQFCKLHLAVLYDKDIIVTCFTRVVY